MATRLPKNISFVNPNETKKKDVEAEDVEKKMHKRREESPMETKLRKFKQERNKIESDLKQ